MSRLPKFNELNTCHFVTTKVWQDIWLFKEGKYCQIIIDNLNFYRQKFNFKLIAYAIMPWHLHLILMLSKRCNDITKVMRAIKSHSARQIIDCIYYTGRRGPLTSPPIDNLGQGTQATRGGYPHRRMSEQKYYIWQPSFYDFNIYSDEKLEQKVNYVNHNAAKHGLVSNPVDYKYSSARNYYLDNQSIIKIDKLDW